MNKKLISILLLMPWCLCMPFTTFASVESWEQEAQRQINNKESKLLPEGVTISSDTEPSIRGRYIASSSVSVSNEGYGVLGVYAHTLAYESVMKIRMNIYLDQWDEDEEAWIQIDSKMLTYDNENGEEDLHSVSESFTVENLEVGKYYRVRGYHAVWSFDGLIESHGTMTNGILLTDGPA